MREGATGAAVADEATIFTIGYEQRSVADLITILRENGIRRLVDVRLTPWSRRPDFCMKRLMASLDGAGICYEHCGVLGNPPEIRELYRAGDSEAGEQWFREHLQANARPAVDDLAHVTAHEPVALLCLERDHRLCHRSVVAAFTAERSENPLVIRHL
ncbi:MAG: DUF488 domain-containing protein [Thermoleophilia bacterium]